MENIIIETIDTEVTDNGDIDVSGNNNIDIIVSEPDYKVTVNKKEYVITGDELYIPSRYEESPQWLRDLIGTITDTSLNQKITELNNLTTTLNQLIVELDVAKNTYTNSIISSADIDERINTRVETLNSSLSDSDATIVDLIATKATPTQASAIATDVLSASINGTTNGTIGALVGSVQTAVSNLDTALSNSIDIVHAEMIGENEITAEAIGSLQAYVGVDSAGASSGTGLSAYLEGSDGVVGSADSKVANNVYVDGNGNVRSKFEYNSAVNVGGVFYNSGFGIATSVNSPGHGIQSGDSQFWINASKFKFTNNNKTGYATPFSIDATGTTPEITFNGKVTFGSGQSGTIDEAIAAVVETVAVGDKNINITDNLIPTTSLVADTDNSGYQFVGTPTKSMSVGLESFSEAQIALDGSDEVYSPYVDEVTIPYYYRFGIKGITDLNRFKIVTINSSNVVSYNYVTLTMESGQSLSAGSWYTVDGIINPIGGTTTADGNIRDINGTKVGSINNFIIASGTTKILLGWIANCTISRMKMCKITADTITSDFSSVNGQLTNLQSQMNNVSGTINANNDLFAQKLGYSDYNAMVTAASAGQTLINGGYVNTLLLAANSISADKINTTGLIAENINATDIIGKNITGGTIRGARIEGAVIMASYLDLNGQLQVLTDLVISVATRNSNPSYYADAVYISADNTYRIPTLSFITEETRNQEISGAGNVFHSKLRSYNCSNAGHNLKFRKSNPTVTINSFLLFSLNYSSNASFWMLYGGPPAGTRGHSYTIYVADQHVGYYFIRWEYLGESCSGDSCSSVYGLALYFNGTKIRDNYEYTSNYNVSNGTFGLTISSRSDAKGWDFYINNFTNSVSFTNPNTGFIRVENNGGDTGLERYLNDISTVHMLGNITANNMN